MRGYQEVFEDGEKVYSATDLNFHQGPGCKHKFKRVSNTRVECTKCPIGFLDNHDFPIEELNEYYSANIDPR